MTNYADQLCYETANFSFSLALPHLQIHPLFLLLHRMGHANLDGEHY